MSLRQEVGKKTDAETRVPLTADSDMLAASQTRTSELRRSLLKAFPAWWRVARMWFNSEEKWRARGFLIAALVLTLIRISMLVKISYTQRYLETALAEREKGGFHKAVWSFAGIIAVAAPLFAATDFVGDRLKLEWRAWLTKTVLSAYYANRSYYKLHQLENSLDNPDQAQTSSKQPIDIVTGFDSLGQKRICDDIPAFTEASTNLMFGISRKVFGVIAFSGVLWSVAPNLVLFLFIYTAFGTWLTTSVFGRQLMQLTYTVLQREGDLRFNLVRTRENSESIAFYGGEGKEQQGAITRLDALVGFAMRRIAWLGGLSLWTNFYSYVTMLIPPLMVAPRYFAGEVEFGVITQVGFAFRHIEGALNYFVDNLDKFSGLAAGTERLDALLKALSDQHEEPLRILHKTCSQGLCLQTLTVRTPSGGRLLCQGLDLTLNPGQSLLIVGPSGCGKSSLLRAICGLWTSGSGIVLTPGAKDMFFLPQKPYMPSGNLRQQLLYPSGTEDAKLALHSSDMSMTDVNLREVLETVALPGLAERVGGFEGVADWSHLLSLGEQQRVAFSRLLLHKPGLAFLDEATGALDIATEGVLYRALQRRNQSFVSVDNAGHRTELTQFHNMVLEHKGGWQWAFSSMQEYLKQRS